MDTRDHFCSSNMKEFQMELRNGITCRFKQKPEFRPNIRCWTEKDSGKAQVHNLKPALVLLEYVIRTHTLNIKISVNLNQP